MSPVCDWCGKHIAAGAAMWGDGIGRRVGGPPTPRWIACSEGHLNLLRTFRKIVVALTLLAVLTIATLLVVIIMIRRDADLIRRAEAWTGQECTKVGTYAIVCRPRDAR